MNYPLISEYIEAIKSAEDNFKELTNLRPIIGYDGQPVMTSGNFAVVFKMEDKDTGKFYALKCFTKLSDGAGGLDKKKPCMFTSYAARQKGPLKQILTGKSDLLP